MRIGIYGGSFNPVHTGHISAAKWACDTLGLSKMLLIPCNISPGKQTPESTPTNCQRLEMLRLAVGEDPRDRKSVV